MNATLIVPTLNEERHIDQLLTELLRQEPGRVQEILVADGGSTDRTREIVAALATRNDKIRLIENPLRIQASGINIAVAAANAGSDIIIRADAHATYPATFVSALLTAIEQHDCESVVVRMKTVGQTCFQQAVAAACNSRLGTGGSSHRIGGESRFVDHGHHAAFRREAFNLIGGYDPVFAANEDAEFDARLRAAGGRIWFANDIIIDYTPRSTFSALARQYFKYGTWRARNFRKNGNLRLRQFLPPVFLFGIVASFFLAFHSAILLSIPLAYVLVVLAVALQLSRSSSNRCVLGALLVLPVIHFSWAFGFWRGLLS